MQPPLENTYWVIPGKFLAGEYPGHWRAKLAAERIEMLEAAGVGLLVDLTRASEPLDPYAALLETAEHVRMPIVDASVPSREQMVEILNLLDGALDRGLLPYVHCWGGIGRTGMVVGCWLKRHGAGSGGAGEDAALRELQRLWRGCAKSALHHSPETPEQEDFIRNWQAGS